MGGGKVNALACVNTETPIIPNQLVVIAEPRVALVDTPITLMVEIIDEFQRIVPDANEQVSVGIFNVDRPNIIIESTAATLVDGVFRITLASNFTSGPFQVNVTSENSQLNGNTILDVHEAVNLPRYSGSGLPPLGWSGNNNNIRYQYLFGGILGFNDFVSRIAWLNPQLSSKTTGGWLGAKIIYGIFEGEPADFDQNLDENFNRVSNPTEVELGNYVVKNIPSENLFYFDLNSETRWNSREDYFFVEYQYFQAIDSTNTSITQSSTISQSASEIRNTFGGRPNSRYFSTSPNEPYLLIKNRFSFSDVWLRSTESDTGIIDIPFQELGQSPDIIVRQDQSLLKPNVKDHQEPRLNLDNFIYIRVRNRGRLNAENVVVSVYWTPLNGALLTGSLIPENFSYTDEEGREVERNFQIVPLIDANENNGNPDAVNQVEFKWRVNDLELPDRNETQYALVVILEHPEDRRRFINGGFEAHSKDNNLSFRRVELRFDERSFFQRILAALLAFIRWLLSLLGF